MRAKIAVFAGLLVVIPASSHADLVFAEDFNSISDGTTITTANSDLTYARVSTGAGSFLKSKDPGSFGGASANLFSSSGSLTGVGVTSGSFTAFDVGTFSFSLRTPAGFGTGAGNDLYLFLGTGTTTFSGNSTFTGNDLLAGFSIFGGQLQTRNLANSWANVGSPLSASTSYQVSILFNGGSVDATYGLEGIAAGKADIWINGTLFGNDVSIRDNQSVSAFRIYTLGSTGSAGYEVDNIELNSVLITPVPEPSTWALFGAGVIGLGFVVRRKSK